MITYETIMINDTVHDLIENRLILNETLNPKSRHTRNKAVSSATMTTVH